MTSVKSTLELIGSVVKKNTIGTRKGTGGITSARYCYSVWFRHLAFLYHSGIANIPEKVIEFGPYDSLGVGFCALLSGVKEYHALDVVKQVDIEKNQRLFEEVLELFESKARIPDNIEFPLIHPEIESYDFPKNILDEYSTEDTLRESRLNQIRKELHDLYKGDNTIIRYIAPWDDTIDINPQSIDMILSQAVMQYVIDLRTAYRLMHKWLKTGGIISHEIDFKSHGTALSWNGHWRYSRGMWDLVNGRAECPINRYPHSFHIREINKSGLKVICDDTVTAKSEFQKDRIDKSLIDYFEDNDLNIQTSFIQAVKT